MYEFLIYNTRTREKNFIFGYSEKDAFSRNPKLDWDEWIVISSKYID